ncbi:autotransporter outer membrane beta-barrel domain-containing protein [Variovorax sp. dw_308]|uniref:autotransporter outer membrane beta-barrel domain-containing protein n=1 Tax=Variovorax sp. dw_308 TaxID=2721546 RepID=UPI001C491524|nr:autotransporter outer membrane beta-barrel domain-containing protein [Variovorax sp. dw_308]
MEAESVHRSSLAIAVLLCGGGGGALAQCVPASAGLGLSCGTSLRPETGAYMGNRRITDLLFVYGLDDRMGDGSVPTASQGVSGAGRGFWMRTGGEGFRLKDDGIGFGVDSKQAVLQAGVDVWQWSLGSTGRLSVGALLSVGGGRTDGTAPGRLFTAQGRTDGGGFGFYATWYQDDQTRLGWYADTWTQYARFRNEVESPLIRQASYTSHNGMASVETGYALRLSDNSSWVIQPQGQLIYAHNHAYNVTQSDGTQVDGAKRGGWTSRLGVRMYPGWIGDGDTRIKPYAAINWLYDHLEDELTYGSQLPSKDVFPTSRYELKAGADLRFAGGWAGWGDIGWQAGSSYSAWTARAGMKYSW